MLKLRSPMGMAFPSSQPCQSLIKETERLKVSPMVSQSKLNDDAFAAVRGLMLP